MIEEIKEDAELHMQKSVQVLATEMSKIRTGRAHTSLLDHISVDYYGSTTPLRQVAKVGVEDARTLSVVPWEKTMVASIEKAIMKADLGLNPMSAGMVIRIPMPPLTEERRHDLVKIVRQLAENSKIAVRNIRRDANSDFKELEKEKEISQDDEHRAQGEIQKLTDKYIVDIDQVLAKKEQDLMEI